MEEGGGEVGGEGGRGRKGGREEGRGGRGEGGGRKEKALYMASKSSKTHSNLDIGKTNNR